MLSICRHVQNSRAAVLTSLKLLLSFLSTPVLSHTMLLNAVCGDEEVTSPPFGFTLTPLFANQTDTQSSWPWMHPAISFSLFFLSFTDFSLFLAAVFLFSVALTCPYTLYPLEFVSYSRRKVLDFHSRLNLLLFSGALFFCSTPFVAIRRRCLPQPIALHETCLTRWISTARRLFGNLRHICYS